MLCSERPGLDLIRVVREGRKDRLMHIYKKLGPGGLCALRWGGANYRTTWNFSMFTAHSTGEGQLV